MKIPETSANVGAYYGDENGQWQPNGVIVETSGAVGGGDARPIYPIHVPRNHIPGYVMAGAYYGGGVAYTHSAAAAPPDDFADYMWMEHEEEFDKQVMQQLEEEALMEQCIEAMLEDEQRERRQRPRNGHQHHHHQYPTTSNGASNLSLEETVSRSTLNPLAAEFVPTFRTQSQENTSTEEKPPEQPTTEAPAETKSEPAVTTPTCTDVTSGEQIAGDDQQTNKQIQDTSTPEVSAADIQPDRHRRDSKKMEKMEKVEKVAEKKPSPPKVEVKKQEAKRKPQPVKSASDTKVQQQPQAAKKKDAKATRSEPRVGEAVDEITTTAPSLPLDTTQPSPPTVEETGPKPINYAAAAKANKPKKPVATAPLTTITAEKITQPTIAAAIKKEKMVANTKDKPIHRKNSAK